MTKTDHSNYMSKAFQMENAVRAQALHWELSWYLPVHVPSMECMGGGAGWGGAGDEAGKKCQSETMYEPKGH